MKCPRCSLLIDPTLFGQQAEEFASLVAPELPWPCRWGSDEGHCLSCGAAITLVTRSDNPVSMSWSAKDTNLVLGRNLSPLFCNQPADPDDMTYAFLWWHPFKNWVPANDIARVYADALLKRIRSVPVKANVIVFTTEGTDPIWAHRNEPLIDEAYEISSSVFSDASGPYPSLKLSRAVNRYLKRQFKPNGVRVVHLWPMPEITNGQFLNIGEAGDAGKPGDGMVKMWGEYSRQNLTVETDK
jgi:hypothetical protein